MLLKHVAIFVINIILNALISQATKLGNAKLVGSLNTSHQSSLLQHDIMKRSSSKLRRTIIRLPLDHAVASSSSSHANHLPSAAIDGDDATFWQLAVGYNYDDYKSLALLSWFQVDLGEEFLVSRVDVTRGRDVKLGDNIWSWQVVRLGLMDEPLDEAADETFSEPAEFSFECDLGDFAGMWNERTRQVIRSSCRGGRGRFLLFQKSLVQCSNKRMSWDIAEIRVYGRKVPASYEPEESEAAAGAAATPGKGFRIHQIAPENVTLEASSSKDNATIDPMNATSGSKSALGQSGGEWPMLLFAASVIICSLCNP